jgi:hypothetical protein
MASENKSDEVNADTLLQPEGICQSEPVTPEHIVLNRILWRQRLYSIALAARSVTRRIRPLQTAFAFRQFQVLHCSASPTRDGWLLARFPLPYSQFKKVVTLKKGGNTSQISADG